MTTTDSSCSKLSDRGPTANSAAYLLFYRRRSPTPLGPQYLQDLVLESRNPTPPQEPAATDDPAAEESDSGEGRLGGAHGSRSSPSGLGGAEAGKSNSLRAGNGGVGARLGQDNNRQMMRMDGTDWNFTSLDDGIKAGDGSDNDSVTANADNDEDGDAKMGEDAADLPELGGGESPVYGASQYDDHGLYSSGRGENEMLHLEDAGAYGYEDHTSPPTVEFDKSPPGYDDDTTLD